MRKFFCGLLLPAVLGLLCACTSGTPGSKTPPATGSSGAGGAFPYTLTDSEGTSVTLQTAPRRVAVLFSSYADVWVTAGGQVAVTVGEAVERGFAGVDAVLVDATAGHTSIDLEALVAAAPDLVIGTADYACQAEAVAFCRSVGIPAALFRVESFADYLSMLRVCCDLTGREDCYETCGTAVGVRIDRLLAAAAAQSEPAGRILFIRAGSSARSTKAKTAADNFVCAMLAELGAVNVAEEFGTLTGTLSLETILEADPSYLFLTAMGDEDAAREYMTGLLSSDGWRELTAVQAGRWCFLPKELFHFKPNARWAEAYEVLIRLLWPEVSLDG